jgi:peroxiredoxin
MQLMVVMQKFIKSVGLKIGLLGMVVLVMTAATSKTQLLTKVIGTPYADNFILMNIDGQDVSLSDYQGRFVLLNFWATWCPPCVKEMPALSELHSELNDQHGGLEVVGIHVGPALATVNQFLNDRPVTFDVLIDSDMSLASWDVAGLPTTFLISPTGQIIYKAVGEREWNSKEMIQLIKDIIHKHEQLTLLDNSNHNT